MLPTEPFLTLDNIDPSGERGLLGIAFHPDFQTNHYVYVDYTVATNPAHNRISRFTANGDTSDLDTEEIIFELEDQRIPAGLGGAITFGADGKLYITVGTNEYVHSNDAQLLTNFWGKMLRLNADGSIPTRQSLLQRRQCRRKQEGYLGVGVACAIHFCGPTGHWKDVHQ